MKRKLCAVLSADAVGYSRRMAVDEYHTVRTIKSHRELMSRIVRARNGRVVDAVGDNLLAEFGSAVDAVTAAMAMQEALQEANVELTEEQRLPFRMGIHLGELLQEGKQIFGDGVNIAARLESLAEPGGVRVSEAVVEQFKGELKCLFEDAGEAQLKNIPYPVRTFAIRPGTRIPDELASTLHDAAFDTRPAIAVMPFENRSDDSELQYLADGIVEDLIAQLSAFRQFPVIARNSTLAYRDQQADARQIADDLGARYVVEGNVRKSGSRIRVSVAVVDASTGHQIHAERYDRELGDLFDLQDEMVVALVGVIHPALGLAERQRARAKPTTDLNAWDCYQRALSHLYDIHSKADIDEALALVLQAQENDPSFATARALEAECYSLYVAFQWADAPEQMMQRALRTAEAAVALGANDPTAHVALGRACSLARDMERSVQAFNRALQLNPSMTLACQGLASAMVSTDPDQAIEISERMLRLSPRDPLVHVFYNQLAVAQLIAKRYELAADWARKAIGVAPDMPQNYRVLAAALGYLGQQEEASAQLDRMLELAPQFSMATYRQANSAVLVEACVSGWKLAGREFPE